MAALSVYQKPYKTPQELSEHLKSKGLTFCNECQQQSAEVVLSRINYYRFKAYLIPYLNEEDNIYTPGTTFKNGMNLYEFDSELRELCNSFILKIEVKIRSQLDQVISQHTNDPFWYLNDDNFYSDKVPSYHRESIRKEMNRSKTKFAKHYREKYKSPVESYRSFPPFWVAAELITFGALMDILKGIDKDSIGSQRNNPLDKMANNFNAENYRELKSWLPLIKEIRNRCSHSSRTWNSNYRLPRGFVDNMNNVINDRITKPPTKKNKIYLGLAIIHVMSKGNIINGSNFKNSLITLFNKYNHIENLEYWMGIPKEWMHEPIWE